MRPINSNLSADDSIEKRKIPYLDIIAVGTIQFLLSLLQFCYGIYLMQFILEGFCNLKTGLWTCIAFLAISKITNPWTKSYCKHLNNIKHKVHKRNTIVAALLLFSALILASFITSPIFQIIFYGGIGGISSAVIYGHVKFSTNEVFKNRPNLFETLDQIMKPICLIFMPHFVLFLTNQYDTLNSKPSQLIIGGLILNIIPATLLIRRMKYKKKPLCKFQTIERLSIEMIDLKPNPLSDSSSSEDEEEEVAPEYVEIEEMAQSEPPTNIQVYYQNVGVKILPNIPEEDESEEDDINEISSKRLSRISAILQELNESDTKNVNTSVNNLFQPDEILDCPESEEEKVADFKEEFHPKQSRCFSINSNTMYQLKFKKQRLKSFFKQHFIRSFPRTLSKPYFYPALISSCITTTLATIIFGAAPYVMLVRNENRQIAMTTVDATFLLTIIGFTWIFFLAGYPVFNKISSFKVKMLYLIGLSISGLSLFIVQKFIYDSFTLFSLTFGLGHGIVNYTENIALEDFFEKENWKKLQGALEISTGLFVILIYLVIYLSSLEIDVLLSHAYWPYVFVVSLWIVAFILKRIIVFVRKNKRYNRERFVDFNF